MTEKIKYVKLDTVLIQMQLSNCRRSAIHDVAELPPEDVIERPTESWKHRKDPPWVGLTGPVPSVGLKSQLELIHLLIINAVLFV